MLIRAIKSLIQIDTQSISIKVKALVDFKPPCAKSTFGRFDVVKLQSLHDLGNAEKILGIQVCAYKDGKVIIDTDAGTLGRYDPRPVQPDSLFPVFSVTKGNTAGMLHWLLDNRESCTAAGMFGASVG